MLLADYAAGSLPPAKKPDTDAIINFLDERKVPFTTWEGWHLLDAAEREAGGVEGRERKKIVEWNDMVRFARPEYEI